MMNIRYIPQRKRFEKNGLEKIFTERLHLRVHVCLPYAPAADQYRNQLYARETKPNGSPSPQPIAVGTAASQQDIIMNIDRSNIHLILGKASDSEENKILYDLLKIATGVSDGWVV